MSEERRENIKVKRPRGPGGHGPMGVGAVENAEDFKGTVVKFSKRYLEKYKIPLIIVFIFAIASTIFTIVGPKILGNATTEIYTGIVGKISGTGGINFDKILEIILILVGLYAISAVFSLIQSLVMTRVSQTLTYKMRDELSKKIHKLPMNFFDKKIKVKYYLF